MKTIPKTHFLLLASVLIASRGFCKEKRQLPESYGNLLKTMSRQNNGMLQLSFSKTIGSKNSLPDTILIYNKGKKNIFLDKKIGIGRNITVDFFDSRGKVVTQKSKFTSTYTEPTVKSDFLELKPNSCYGLDFSILKTCFPPNPGKYYIQVSLVCFDYYKYTKVKAWFGECKSPRIKIVTRK